MNIVVVDDDNLVAISLKTILEASEEVNVLEIGGSGEQAIELYEKHKPDILLMDIRMGGMSGIEAGEAILKKHPDARILYLTTFSDDEYIVKALKLGTKGYILKQNFECIVPALHTVMEGQTVFGDDVITRLPSLMQKKSGIDYEKFDINDKEKEIIELIAEGLSNKEIAIELFLSEGTVRNYLSSILEKLELRDRTQLAVYYYNSK